MFSGHKKKERRKYTKNQILYDEKEFFEAWTTDTQTKQYIDWPQEFSLKISAVYITQQRNITLMTD